MKVGDLVQYKIGAKRSDDWPVGIILRTPEQTNNGDFEVWFTDVSKRQFCREMFLHLI